MTLSLLAFRGESGTLRPDRTSIKIGGTLTTLVEPSPTEVQSHGGPVESQSGLTFEPSKGIAAAVEDWSVHRAHAEIVEAAPEIGPAPKAPLESRMPPASTRAILSEVLNAARAELKAQEGSVRNREVGHAELAEAPTEGLFRVANPIIDIVDAPGTEMFLASNAQSEQRLKVLQVVLATRKEIVVRVQPEIQFPANLSLFSKQDPTLVMKRLIAFLEKVEDPKLSRVMISAGPLSAGSSVEREGLNSEQQVALGAMTTSGVSFVWGPPGTGKTRVIGAAIAHLVAARKTVALVSHTNVAVDQALLQVCAAMDNLRAGSVLRIGHPSLTGVTEHQFLTPDRALKIVGDRVSRELAELTEQLSVARGLRDSESIQQIQSLVDGPGIKAVRQALAQREALKTLKKHQRQLQKAQRELLAHEQTVADAEQQFQQDHLAVQDLTEHQLISEFQNRLSVKRTSFEKLTLTKITIELDIAGSRGLPRLKRRKVTKVLNEELHRVHREIDAVTSSITQDEEVIADAASRGVTVQTLIEARALESSSKETLALVQKQRMQASARYQVMVGEMEQARRIPELSESQIQLLTLIDASGSIEKLESQVEEHLAGRALRKSDVEKLTSRIEKLQKELLGLSQEMIRSASVIGTTLSQLFVHPQLVERTFDHVIIDEVSAALTPLVVGALAKASDGATLVGDFEQNGPISNVKRADLSKLDPGVRSWLEMNSFQKFDIDSAASAQIRDGCSILTKQYRFGPATMDLANAIAYNGILESVMPWRAADHSQEITIIDTSSLRDAGDAQTSPHRSGRWWPAGVAAALALTQRHPDIEIGIVTPYRDQSLMTKASIADQHLQNVQVGTSHAFQGQEFPVVLVDLVEDGTGKSWVAQSRRPGSKFELDGVRLFNVAVTRNSGKLYILANAGAISGARRGPLHYLGNMARDGRVATIDAREFLGHVSLSVQLGPSDESESSLEVVPPRFDSSYEILNDSAFYQAFEQDLSMATREVVILSPFIASNRLTRLLPSLKAHSDRGIKFKISTKTAREIDHPELLDELRGAGFKVTEVAGMHEKIVVIDRRTTYVGSLNVLSNNGWTRELMFRFDGPEVAQRTLGYLAPAGNRR